MKKKKNKINKKLIFKFSFLFTLGIKGAYIYFFKSISQLKSFNQGCNFISSNPFAPNLLKGFL